MAEEVFQPQPPPPNAPKYYHPGFYYYTPEPYETTHIPKHHRHAPPPLKFAQHVMHDFAHPYGDGYPLPAPHCDIRESNSAYYVDIELPGLRDKKDVRLRWTGARSLFIDASIQRQPLPEEALEPSAGSSSEVDGHDKNKNEKHEKTFHFLKRERKTGELARAFNFPVDVEQDRTVAKLAYGVLTVTVPKTEKEQQEEHKQVEIDHAGH